MTRRIFPLLAGSVLAGALLAAPAAAEGPGGAVLPAPQLPAVKQIAPAGLPGTDTRGSLGIDAAGAPGPSVALKRMGLPIDPPGLPKGFDPPPNTGVSGAIDAALGAFAPDAPAPGGHAAGTLRPPGANEAAPEAAAQAGLGGRNDLGLPGPAKGGPAVTIPEPDVAHPPGAIWETVPLDDTLETEDPRSDPYGVAAEAGPGGHAAEAMHPPGASRAAPDAAAQAGITGRDDVGLPGPAATNPTNRPYPQPGTYGAGPGTTEPEVEYDESGVPRRGVRGVTYTEPFPVFGTPETENPRPDPHGVAGAAGRGGHAAEALLPPGAGPVAPVDGADAAAGLGPCDGAACANLGSPPPTR